jgi:hypothetical protein
MSRNKGEISLEDLLSKVNNKTKSLITELESEEKNERVETLDSVINDIKGQKEQTKLNKLRFINEIKNGLGEKIKENPNEIMVIKKPWYSKLGKLIKNIFTKF